MTRDNKDAEWRWIDGNEATSIKWQPGQPNNYANDDNCSLLSDRHANDIPVTFLTYYNFTKRVSVCVLDSIHLSSQISVL